MKIHLSVQQLQGFIHVSEGRLELCTQTQGSDSAVRKKKKKDTQNSLLYDVKNRKTEQQHFCYLFLHCRLEIGLDLKPPLDLAEVN